MMQPVHHVSEQVSTISSGQTLVAVVHGAARFNNGLILLRCGAMGCRASPGDRDKPAHDEAIERMRPENGT